MPSIVVPVSLIAGRAELTLIVHQVPPPELAATAGTKRIAFAPVMAFAFIRNWRSVPCCSRSVPATTSSFRASPRAFTTTLKLKPESMFATFAPETIARVTCSGAISAELKTLASNGLSDTVGERPP